MSGVLKALRDLVEHTSNMEAQHPDYHGEDGPNLSPPLVAAVTALRNANEAEADLLAALKEAQYFILAPAEDLKDGVLSRIRAAIAKAEGRP